MVKNNWKGEGGRKMAYFRVLAIDQRTCTKILKQILFTLEDDHCITKMFDYCLMPTDVVCVKLSGLCPPR